MNSMKKYGREIFIIALFVLACVVLVLFDYVFVFSPDETLNALIKETLSRIIVFGILVPTAILCGYKRVFTVKVKLRDLLWCLPCLLVAIVNFPFTAIISGAAKVERVDLIWLFALDCLGIGLLEELLFRGILQSLLFDVFKKKRVIFAVFVNSLVFGAWHLVNLFAGAGIGDTLLQVGYSFLIGGMLSAVFLRTGNLWVCVFLHALFDFGGLIVTRLGTGAFQDITFWVLTAVTGVLCLCHVLLYLLRTDKKKPSAGEESETL